MATLATTFTTYDAKGIKEDLADVIYNISPVDTPTLSNGGRGSTKQTLHEWQTDALAAVDGANAQLEGDDITTFPALTATTRVGNICQISRKLALVSDTEEEVDKAGRDSEMAYQLTKKSKELKRDLETIILSNQGAAVGAVGTARKTAAFLAWIKTNVNMGTGTAANPTYTSGVPTGATGRVDGTTRAFTEAIFVDVVQKIWASGGELKYASFGPSHKVAANPLLTGIATKTFFTSAKKAMAVIGAVDLYVSDFGNIALVPNRYQREKDIIFIDPAMYSVRFFRSFRTKPLAKTGDAEKRMMICEWCLRVNNEAAFGLVTDLT